MYTDNDFIEVAEIVLVQNYNFEFWMHKNRHGRTNYYINSGSVPNLFNKKLRLVIVDKSFKVLSDNQYQKPVIEGAAEIIDIHNYTYDPNSYAATEIYPLLSERVQ
ncbi:hypothetical protein EBB07_28680 [Paenibacillaceae bacterium]|nr:hypothetical protein EBB07_28680 [Paenibacillaceae bacterium]